MADRNRASYLALIRLEIQAKAMEAQRLLEEKDQKDRSVRQFSIGDLILIRLSSKAKKMLAAQRGSVKVMPSWSLPYRVIQVFKNGSTAYVQSVLSGERQSQQLVEVQMQNARFIEPPQSPEQQQLWEQAIQGELDFSVLDLQVYQPLQAAGLDRAKSALGGSKRRRVRSLSRASLEEGR